MTFIIAEIGVNHQGDYLKADMLCRMAQDAGADAAKFQLFNSRKLWGDDRLEDLQLTRKDMTYLVRVCESIGIEFMCTPFDVESVEFLVPFVRRMKVASGCRKPDIISAVYKTGLPVIVSTGMSDLNDLQWIVDSKPDGVDLTLLQCTSCYPCALEDVNLRAMIAIKNRYFLDVGYSDHTLSLIAPALAVSMGATIIEKHLTFNRKAEGPDHQASLEPEEFRQMVVNVREAEKLLGNGEKKVLPCEEELRRQWYGKS